MVRGLERFRQRFGAFAEQYVLIGGGAATLAMRAAGLGFRATKDLDIVLHVEALTAEFVAEFWHFVREAGYASLEAGGAARPKFYRFAQPADPRYPAMLELFARAPVGLELPSSVNVTRIALQEDVSSLSAILMDVDYYRFVMSGRQVLEGVPCIGHDRLIPLKALAWLELSERRAAGAAVDARDVRKHLNDVLRLTQLLAPADRIEVPGRIAQDLQRFIAEVSAAGDVRVADLGLGALSLDELLERVRKAYLQGAGR